MAESTILPFAGESPNILTQGEYLADTQRLIGHQPGIARASLENKVLKQASLLSAALAKFVADNQGTDISDDMTVDDLAVAIAEAISVGVPTATETVEGKVELATASETQLGASETGHTVVVTPEALATLTASEARRGLARFATIAETLTTLGTKAVTPKGLSARLATTTQLGLAELALDAEAIAGVPVVDHPALVLTPTNLAAWAAAQFAADFSANGWATFPGGFTVQWGTFLSTGSPEQTFPIPFPNACFAVVLNGTGHVDSGVESFTATDFLPNIQAGSETVWWIAVGH